MSPKPVGEIVKTYYKESMPKSDYSVDLIKQMAECDANYIRLLKLVPEMSAYLDRSFADIDSTDEARVRRFQTKSRRRRWKAGSPAFVWQL